MPFDKACGGTDLEWTDVLIQLFGDHDVAPVIRPRMEMVDTAPIWYASLRSLRAVILSKCCRIEQLQIEMKDVVSTIVDLVLDLDKKGWLPHHFRYLQYSTQGYLQMRSVRALHATIRAMRRRRPGTPELASARGSTSA